VQLAASLSDAVLASVCVVMGGWLLLRPSASGRTAGLGLWIVGAAAVMGTLRFGGVQGVAVAHAGLTGLAATVGLPCIGAGWASAAFAPERAASVRRYVFGVCLVLGAMLWAEPWARTGMGAVSMLAVLAASAAWATTRARDAALGVVGAVLTLAMGLVVGTDGSWMGLPNVAWFHLGLAAANLALGAGLLHAPVEASEAG
jgi:hypothetical protein